jgi:hypothetical protein
MNKGECMISSRSVWYAVVVAVWALSCNGQTSTPNFELVNKSTHTLYISTGMSMREALKKPLRKILPTGVLTTTIENEKPVYLLIYSGEEAPKNLDQLYAFKMSSHRTYYVKVADATRTNSARDDMLATDDFVFGPQIGPFKGFLRKTESGFSLKNNVQLKDIRAFETFYITPTIMHALEGKKSV